MKSDLTTAVQGKRVPLVLGGLSMLSIVPKLGIAAVKRDARSMSDAAGSISSSVGALKGWKADFYSETVLKEVPNKVALEQFQCLPSGPPPTPLQR